MLCYSYLAIFHAHIAPRMSTKAIIQSLRTQGFQDLPAVILIESHMPHMKQSPKEGWWGASSPDLQVIWDSL